MCPWCPIDFLIKIDTYLKYKLLYVWVCVCTGKLKFGVTTWSWFMIAIYTRLPLLFVFLYFFLWVSFCLWPQITMTKLPFIEAAICTLPQEVGMNDWKQQREIQASGRIKWDTKCHNFPRFTWLCLGMLMLISLRGQGMDQRYIIEYSSYWLKCNIKQWK